MNEPAASARRQLAVPPPGTARALPDPIEPRTLREDSRRWWNQVAAMELAPDIALAPLRKQARAILVELAQRHTASYLIADASPSLPTPPSIADHQPLVLSGHQPTLFHPGVWFKNFLLGELAAKLGGIGIHFLVDQDAAGGVGFQVPHRTLDHQLTLGYRQIEPSLTKPPGTGSPAPLGSIPWEYQRPGSLGAWQQFPQRLAEQLAFLPESARLIDRLWPTVLQCLQLDWPVGASLSAGRHQIQQGYLQQVAAAHHIAPPTTYELPLSQLCQQPPFADFCWALISQIERLHPIYNACRQRYRQEHRVSNPTQPVAPLAENDGWLESPFWVYSRHQPQRRSLWVRTGSSPGNLELSNRAGWHAIWSGEAPGDSPRAHRWASFQRMQQSGVCLRPKALMTTLFARLCVGDIFIHGIGGGLYDAMTEAICRAMWQIELCPIVVASATFCLPIDDSAEETRWPSDILQQAWTAWHHPEQLLSRANSQGGVTAVEPLSVGDSASVPASLAELIQQKQRLLANIPPRGQKLGWHKQLMTVNAQLREALQVDRQAHLPALRQAEAYQRQQRVVNFREYSLALFPPQPLLDRLRSCAEQLIGHD
jgi:hypothetical protein